MARQSKADQQKAKEAKQKKILLGLLPLLGILVFLQAPKLMHHNAGNVALAPAPAPAAAPAEPSAAPSLAVAPSVGAAATPTAATAATPSSALADTDAMPVGREGQLVVFDLFSSKDPFVQQVKSIAEGSSASPSSDAPASSGSSTKPSAGPFSGAAAKPSAPAEARTAVAALSVNGLLEQTQPAHDFPAAAPVFHLVSATASTARIAIIDGAYQDGAATLALPKGKTVTLLNTADGTRYALVYRGLVKVPTASLPATAPAPTTTTATTTTPAPPTTTTTSAPMSG